MFDVDKFIECVQARTALWEKSDNDYSDRRCRERAWLEIGEIMFDNWEEYDVAERDENVKNLKSKWRNVRDNFQKFVNQVKSGDIAQKKKKYVYADSLSFLLSTMETSSKRHTSGNIAANAQEEDEIEIEGEKLAGEKKLAATFSNREPRRKSQPFRVLGSGPRKPGILTTFQTKLLKKCEEISKPEDEDADTSFLLSLLPDYKKLNYDEKLDFRITALQFFRDLRRKKYVNNLPPNQLSKLCFPTTQSSTLNQVPLCVRPPSPMMPTSSSPAVQSGNYAAHPSPEEFL